MGLFDRRTAFKPFEHPEAVKYKEAIQRSYWLVDKWNFLSDAHDFRTKTTDHERAVLGNALLAISQIELDLKRFWARLGDRLPKPEFDQVGGAFAESEVRHADTYSRLLDVLGLEADFQKALSSRPIALRVAYLKKNLAAADASDQAFAHVLVLFTLFVEYASLFSQFLIIKSFNREKGLFKDVENAVQATMKEETLHALFGVYLFGLIKAERPEWFGEDFYERLTKATVEAMAAELGVVDWIMQDKDLPWLSRVQLYEFVKRRLNEASEMVGGGRPFDVDHKCLAALRWFDDDCKADVNVDQFHKKSVTYTKHASAITPEDLF